MTASFAEVLNVVPRSQGGPDTWENLVCACVRCNSRKGGRTPQEAGEVLVTAAVGLLSQYIRVVKSSAPWEAIAASTFVAFTRRPRTEY